MWLGPRVSAEGGTSVDVQVINNEGRMNVSPPYLVRVEKLTIYVKQIQQNIQQ